MNQAEQLSTATPETKQLALLGMGMFIDVSMQKPNLVAAQAALIAQRCQIKNLNPEPIGVALLADSFAMQRILEEGNKQHDIHRASRKITMPEVERVVKNDFDEAKKYLILQPNDLERVYNNMYERFRGGEITTAELFFEILGLLLKNGYRPDQTDLGLMGLYDFK